MKKGVFSIMPESGTADDRKISVNCDAADGGGSEEKVETVNVSGGGITKSVTLKRKMSISELGKWMKLVNYPGTNNKWYSPIISITHTAPSRKTNSWTFGNLDTVDFNVAEGYYFDYGLEKAVKIVDKFVDFVFDDTIESANGAMSLTKILQQGQMINISLGSLHKQQFFTLYVNNVMLADATDLNIADVTINDLNSYLNSLGWTMMATKYYPEDTYEMLTKIQFIKAAESSIPILLKLVGQPIAVSAATQTLILRLM